MNSVEKQQFHLHLVSDATGETLLSAGRAVAVQYSNYEMIPHIYPMVRNEKQLQRVLDEIAHLPGIILYTILDEKLSAILSAACKNLGLPSVDLLQPLLAGFSAYLGQPNQHRASAQHELNAQYFNRIAAIDFTIDHDDGQSVHNLKEADVILVGISRTSKTPTSIYLAHRGLKTANIPLVKGIELPAELFEVDQKKIIGLVASIDRIVMVRQSRGVGSGFGIDAYTDRENIQNELSYARKLFNKYNWPVLDVSRKSIEETSASILAILGKDNV